jgi:CHAD domain-containing protein
MTGGLDDAVRERAYQLSLGAPDATPEENWDRARRDLEAELGVLYDTDDLRLQQLEMALTRIAANGEVVWRLRLARGELIEAAAPPDNLDQLPDDITGLLSGVIGDEAIAPAPSFVLDAGVARLRAMLGEQRRALLTHEAGVRIGTDPENLHKHRVAARRARAFLRATRDLTAPEWREPLNEGLRALGELTGPVRDLDVLIEYLDTQRSTLGDDDQPGVERLRAEIQAERETRREALLAGLASDEYRALIEALDAPPQLVGEIESIPLDDVATRELRRLLKAIRRLDDHPADAALHALRITVKRARYAAELAGPGDAARDRFLEEARKLQKLLGDHQDAAVAEAQLRAGAAAADDPRAAFAAGLLAERQHARRARATKQLPSAWRRLRKLQASAP